MALRLLHFLDLLLKQVLSAHPHRIRRPILQLKETRQQCLAKALGSLYAIVSSDQDARAGWKKLHTSRQQRWQMVDRDVRQWGVWEFVELYRRAVEIGRLVAEGDRVVGIRRITWKIHSMSWSTSVYLGKRAGDITNDAQSSLAFAEEILRDEFRNTRGGQVYTVYEDLIKLARTEGMAPIRDPRLILVLREKARLISFLPNPTSASNLQALRQPCTDSAPQCRSVRELQ